VILERNFNPTISHANTMLKIILVAILLIVVAFAIVVATRPGEFRVTRTATMAAPADLVFARVNDLHQWDAWSPWAKLDPGMKQTHAGAPAGPGAVYSWAGNKDVGEGRMTITESRTNELVRIQLEFLKPFASVNTTEFTFTPQGDQTTVAWSMTGKNNFIAKAFCMFMDMDKMVGGDFEKGLAQMKALTEAAATEKSRAVDAKLPGPGPAS
jgi:hypothetical protein